MVVFNECRISPEGECLVLEASIDNLSWYKDVYIESVIIDTEETFTPGSPSHNPVYKKEYDKNVYMPVGTVEQKDCDAVQTEDTECRCGNIYTKSRLGHIRLVIPKEKLAGNVLNDHVFFVYVTASGVPAPNTPCGMDNAWAMRVIVNYRLLYDMAMKYVRELNEDCEVPKGFIDMFLRLHAFQYALRTGNYMEAIDMWKRLFKGKHRIPVKSRCGCHGIGW